MTWNPLDRSNSNNPMLPWDQMTWRQRVSAAALWGFMWGAIFPAMFIAVLSIMGMMIEGIATHSEQLDRCQRQAVTPYDYHRCR